MQVGGETKFSIAKEHLADVTTSWTRYEADLVAKKAAQEAELWRKKESEVADTARKSIRSWEGGECYSWS